ncbi:MAG: hypothetical protein AAF447_22105 [Myxococcota bacterium]
MAERKRAALAPLLALVLVGAATAAGAYGAWRLLRAFAAPPAAPVVDLGVATRASARRNGRPADRAAPRVSDAAQGVGDATRRELEAARGAMRSRYRPGPHVEVVGLLPAGLETLPSRRSEPRMAPASSRSLDNPWVVAGAVLVETAPEPGGSGRVVLGPDEGPAPRVVIPHAPTRVSLRSEGPEVAGVAARFEGWPGTFLVPHAVESELGRLQVVGEGDGQLELGLPATDGRFSFEKETEVVLLLAAVDASGRRSPWVRRVLRVLPVGAGDVEVTLAMERSSDLDLYAVGPAGAVVYYANDAAGGGRLDLDANAACRDNLGVDTEHVVWDPGAAPPGTYAVRVAHYERCNVEGPIPYRVTVRACGEVAVLAGRFEADGDRRPCTSVPPVQASAWCQEVLRFDVPPCAADPGRAKPP